MKEFVSNLGSSMEGFLEFKHALGMKYRAPEFYLHELDRYNFDHGNFDSLTKDVTEGWALERATKTHSEDRSWVPPIREFGRYLINNGKTDAYILNNKFVVRQYHAEVYLMTEDEIQRFFEECDRYVLRVNYPGRPYVFPALFRFMYCCGVRSTEARQLKCEDVHLNNGYVDILWAKAHRDRRLFLSDELILYLNDYNAAIQKVFPNREYFFPGVHGGICSANALALNFRHIWKAAGLRYDGKVKPRAYDFRHHFACSNIMRWSSEGKDVHAMLPYLMRYMGHSSLESTYYYIHLIPDYFPKYRDLTSSTENLIPEVDDDEV